MIRKAIKIRTVYIIIWIVSIFTISAFPSFPPPVYAASGDVDIVSCMKSEPWTKYAQILRFFWDNIVVEGFSEGLIEPWNDIIFSNSCQAGDLLALIDRQDQIERSIAKYLLTCEFGQYTAAQKEYYKMSAEIYYVRHVLDRQARFGLPIDTATAKQKEDYTKESTIEGKDKIWANIVGTKSDTALKTAMKKKFVTPLLFSSIGSKDEKAYMITKEEFDNVFNRIADKYRDKKMDYAVCDFEPWQEIADKIKEFKKVKEELDNIDKAWENGKSKIGKAWETMTNSFKSPQAFFAGHIEFSATLDGLKEFGTAISEIGQYVVEGGKTIGDMSKAYYEAAGYVYYSRGFTATDAMRGVDYAHKQASRMQNAAVLQSELEVLYASSDGMVSSYVNELVLMDRTVQATFPILKAVKGYSYEMQKTSYGPDGEK